MIIPRHLQIETVNGYCTARCTICMIKKLNRKREIMNDETFTKILEKFHPYRQHFQYLTLHGLGEPLLDKHLTVKVKIAKEMEFRGTGFATNCTELNEITALQLISAGLDTIICSIDGFRKDTHESIRVGTNFEQVVNNVTKFIELRNKIGSTRIIIRFIRQKTNYSEWPKFFTYWSGKLNRDFGDEVVKFDVHNCANELSDYEKMDIYGEINNQGLVCQDIFERILIYANGEIGFCCGDVNGFFKLGNVLQDDPIEIYNNYPFSAYRVKMKEGKISELEHCKDCSISRSRLLKSID
jgi:MoaA/NifB/PqqE/SkfB family radical SAM enzyme